MPPRQKSDQRWPTTAELDLEQRLNDEAKRVAAAASGEAKVTQVPSPFAVEDNDTSGYVGVSQEYMTYADERDKPLVAEGNSASARLERELTSYGAVGKTPVTTPGATQGGGSNQELVYSATSGEGYQPAAVDRAKVYEEAANADGPEEVGAALEGTRDKTVQPPEVENKEDGGATPPVVPTAPAVKQSGKNA